MPTLKKFLHYYKPHKAMLIFDLICATVVSLVDISFPQILNILNKSLFTMDATVILHTIGFVAIGLIVMYLIKLFCDYFIATCFVVFHAIYQTAAPFYYLFITK